MHNANRCMQGTQGSSGHRGQHAVAAPLSAGTAVQPAGGAPPAPRTLDLASARLAKATLWDRQSVSVQPVSSATASQMLSSAGTGTAGARPLGAAAVDVTVARLDSGPLLPAGLMSLRLRLSSADGRGAAFSCGAGRGSAGGGECCCCCGSSRAAAAAAAAAERQRAGRALPAPLRAGSRPGRGRLSAPGSQQGAPGAGASAPPRGGGCGCCAGSPWCLGPAGLRRSGLHPRGAVPGTNSCHQGCPALPGDCAAPDRSRRLRHRRGGPQTQHPSAASTAGSRGRHNLPCAIRHSLRPRCMLHPASCRPRRCRRRWARRTASCSRASPTRRCGWAGRGPMRLSERAQGSGACRHSRRRRLLSRALLPSSQSPASPCRLLPSFS